MWFTSLCSKTKVYVNNFQCCINARDLLGDPLYEVWSSVFLGWSIVIQDIAIIIFLPNIYSEHFLIIPINSCSVTRGESLNSEKQCKLTGEKKMTWQKKKLQVSVDVARVPPINTDCRDSGHLGQWCYPHWLWQRKHKCVVDERHHYFHLTLSYCSLFFWPV